MKRCRKCGEEKSLSDFHKDRSRRDGHCDRCKKCNNVHATHYVVSDPRRRWAYELQRNYGLTVEDYERLAAQQDNKCAICDGEPTLKGRNLSKLFVDHCHNTGKVRGLLCGHCNTGLGYFKDQSARLQRAISYLEAAP